MKQLFQKNILFPKLFELKKQHGFDRIATGHYAVTQYDNSAKVMRVYRAIDAAQDEAELLLGLNQDLIKCLDLPLGTLPLSMCQKIAIEIGILDFLPLRNHEVWSKLEDFATRTKYDHIQKRYAIYLPSGERVGSVDKGIGYSIGDVWDSNLFDQGFEYDRDVAYCIHQVDHATALIQLTIVSANFVKSISIKNLIWFSMNTIKVKSLKCHMTWRKRSKPIPMTLIEFEGNRAKVYLEETLSGQEADLFPGQIVLFLADQEILGGAEVLQTLSE